MLELKCPFCKAVKREMTKKEYNDALKEIGKKWDELDPITQTLFKINKYVATCDCHTKHGLFEYENARLKQGNE